MASAAPILVLLVALAATGSNADSSLFRLLRQTKDKQRSICTMEDITRICFTRTSSSIMDMKKLAMDVNMQLLCSSWDAAKVCVKGYAASCWGKESGGILFDQQNNVAGYMCGDGRKAALEESACWSNQVARKRVDECTQTMTDSNQKLHSSPSTKPQDYCPVYKTLKSCIAVSIYDTCRSKAAANFMDRMYYEYLAPDANAAKCKNFTPDFEVMYEMFQFEKRPPSIFKSVLHERVEI